MSVDNYSNQDVAQQPNKYLLIETYSTREKLCLVSETEFTDLGAEPITATLLNQYNL